MSTPQRSRFRIAHQCCADRTPDLVRDLRRLPGIETVEFSPAERLLVVDHDSQLAPEDLRRRASRLGVALAPADAGAERAERHWWHQPQLLALVAATALLVAGLVVDDLAGLEGPGAALYLATIGVGGFYPVRGAIQALRARRLTITTLLVVAGAGAVVLGVYEEAALLVVIFSLGGVLEEYAAARARNAIRALMALAPPEARRRLPDGTLEAVPVEELSPGDTVIVRPGERLPTDGVVVGGWSAVDQSAITGESMPVEAGPGSAVFGGTVNGPGALEVDVTKEYADTVLARIVRQVEEAQASKGRAQRFADRFGAVYTPVAFGLATLVATFPVLLGGDAREWTYRALVVVVASCSCALVISVPVAVVAAISRAARDGILIKGGLYLEVLGGVDAIAFDKTGTLTKGRAELTDVVPLDGFAPEEALRRAAAVEAASDHPLAEAIIRGAGRLGVAWVAGRDLRAYPGVGVEASVDGTRYFVGRPNGSHLGSSGAVGADVEALEGEGKTAVVLAEDGRALAILAVADELREEAADVVADLRSLGVRHVLMLTGDNDRVAGAIAGRVGVDGWRSELLPEDKTSAIEALRAEYGAIAMVGDGVNDAPALAVADLGIAMGAAGSDVALETADVALMADDLGKLPEAIRLSRRALAVIRENVVLSVLTVVSLLVAALGGFLSLTTALLLNEGAALLIIANGLRLLAPGSRGLLCSCGTHSAAAPGGRLGRC